MRTLAFLLLLSFAALVAAEPAPPPKLREVVQLIEKLGGAEFTEREAAMKRLEELGAAALEDLRAACKSENPEIADRAKELVRKIERRVSGERVLAPTVVELSAKRAPLDAVLADLSRQSGYEVVLGGPVRDVLAAKKVTVATGKVPFWTAVLKVCDTADLQIAGAGGFLAPGSSPYAGAFGKTADGTAVRFTLHTELAVVLEARDRGRRPASVHGAVLVEAVEAPRGAAAPGGAAVLQFWPEPKLAWQSVSGLKTLKAVAVGDRLLAPEPPATPDPPRVGKAPGMPVSEQPTAPGTRFNPNIRQTLVKFKPGDGLTPLSCELTGSAFVVVRTAVEPLATVTLDPQKAVAVTGQAGVELTAAVRADAKGKKFVDVTLSYPPTPVEPARPGDELPGAKPGTPGGNRSLLGVRVTDADGAAFALGLANQTSDFDRTGRRVVVKMALELVVARDGSAVPAKVVFWGTTVKAVEVPFTLKDVPLR